MEHSQLTWEEVSQYEKVDERYDIYRHNGQLYIAADEGEIVGDIVIRELPNELFQLLENGEKTEYEIYYKLRYDRWPPTEEERKIAKKKFLAKHPTSLINVPKNRELFTQEELEELIPIAEDLWIKGEGKLPDDYVSPLK